MGGVAREQRKRLRNIEDELQDVKRQMDRIWRYIATSDTVMADASLHIKELQDRQERLEDAAEDARGLEMEWRVAMGPGRRRKLEPESGEALTEKAKAEVRAKVEHPFLRLKRLFGYAKVRYRGLAKNGERVALLFGLGNLLTAEGQLRA